MAASYFLDTNILVYAFEPDDPIKRARARDLIAPDIPWEISWQVVQEFIHVARHRFRRPLDPAYLVDLIDLLLASHCSVLPSAHLWTKALTIQTETQYRFYDALIVASAIESGAPILYSEDLQHERRIGPLQIINPFL
jgi:predicted nucleic acid-binding protein